MNMKRILGYILVCILAAALVSSCGQKASETAEQPPTSLRQPQSEAPSPAGDKAEPEDEPTFDMAGAEVLYKGKCSACHALDRVQEHAGHVQRWSDVVTDMIEKRGAKISSAEAAQIVWYLDEAFPK